MQTSRPRTILIGEDEPEVRGYFQMALKCAGYSVELAQDGDEVLAWIRSRRREIDAVLLDIMMNNRDGIDTLREIRAFDPDLPVIMVSGAASPLNIVNAMKMGATDFLSKPVPHEELRGAMDRALERAGVGWGAPIRVASEQSAMFAGRSPRMAEIQNLIGRIGWSEAPVLIQGETGSGKEVIARELHVRSPRAGKPFLKLNCAALPSELVESELFGYERGAFTGAFQKKAGMFENADGGTLLLDEIGDMDVRLQSKLLQVLQDSSFQRIGGKDTIKVDVRIIAATHRDLEKAIVDGQFREDVYYRLNVINVQLPALRDRKEDLPELAEFLLKKHSPKDAPAPALPLDLRQAMLAYHWPGNVRELENCVRKYLIFRDPAAAARELREKTARKRQAAATEIPEPVSPRHEDAPILKRVVKAKQQAETEAILAALDSTRWNRKRAAALLSIDYKALLYKMKKLGIDGRNGDDAESSSFTSTAAGAA